MEASRGKISTTFRLWTMFQWSYIDRLMVWSFSSTEKSTTTTFIQRTCEKIFVVRLNRFLKNFFVFSCSVFCICLILIPVLHCNHVIDIQQREAEAKLSLRKLGKLFDLFWEFSVNLCCFFFVFKGCTW